MDYSFLKHSHAGLAYLTIMLFVFRFVLFYFAPVWRRNKFLKIVPHVIDTALLVFAILLVVAGSHSVANVWLIAKVVGLIAYIAFAAIAIKRASRPAFAGALVSFAYVIGVAKYKTALSWLVLL